MARFLVPSAGLRRGLPLGVRWERLWAVWQVQPSGGGLTADQSTKVKAYVTKEKRSSVKVTEKVAVGEPLPSSVQFYAIPADAGVQTQYRYTVVNDRTVLVDPGTRRVIQVIE